MRVVCLFVLILLVVPPVGATQQGDSILDLWLTRSRTLTDELIKDSAALGSSERALLWARLSAKWWRDDSERARAWMLKSVETVESVPNKENPDERRRRVTTVRVLLQIAAPLDQKLSTRLVAVLTQDAEQEAKTQHADVDGLVAAALSLVDSNPKLATELGVLALRLGHPSDITSLLWKLRGRNLTFADLLFGQAVATGRETLDADLLNSLGHAVFPEYRTTESAPTVPVATDEMRRELLKVYVAYLQANQVNSENRDANCMSLVSFVLPVLAEFDRLLPLQAPAVRQSVNQCPSLSPLGRQRADDALRDQPLNTVEDLLKAADDAQDLKVRTVYQYRAAKLATQRSDFDRALMILDSMSDEARALMGVSWDAYRWDWAAVSANRHLKSGDVYGMHQVINLVPRNLQAFAKIAFVRRLPPKVDQDTDPTLEFLNDARKELARYGVSDAEKCGWYFSLLRLVVKFHPVDGTDVLKEAIAVLNHLEETKDKNSSKNAPASLVGSENLSASLLEMNEYAVKEAISSITSANIRVYVRLELLNGCLERVRSSKQATPNTRQSASKGQ